MNWTNHTINHLPWETIYEFASRLSLQTLYEFGCTNSKNSNIMWAVLEKGSFDLRSIPKYVFDFICQFLLLSLHQVVFLCLSDDDETPHQPELFLAINFPINPLSSLKSLSLYQIGSEQTLQQLMERWSDLLQLDELKLIKCYVRGNELNRGIIMNSIWRLPKLTKCYLDITFKDNTHSTSINIPSSTLKNLTIESISYSMPELDNLFQQTQNLETILIKINHKERRPLNSPMMLKMTTLELHVERYNYLMYIPLAKTINLTKLKVRSSTTHLDGHQWENIISPDPSHNRGLPLLKKLQFKMRYPSFTTNYKEHLEVLLKSFETPFWKNRRWYVCCHVISEGATYSIDYYTIPYAFADFSLGHYILCGSTRPDPVGNYRYRRVKDLFYHESFQPCSLLHPPVSFSNIHRLCIPSPFDNKFLSSGVELYELKSLEVSKGASPSSVQDLLNQTTQLKSLILHDYMFELNNVSIHRLDLLSHCDYLTSAQCDALSRSRLCCECEILLIKVQIENYKQSVLDIVSLRDKMPKLRALTVQFKCGNRIPGKTFIRKLRRALPTSMIGKDPQNKRYIRIWIG